ncbi:MAG: DUF4190 domain-containing protein, partial [Syntrophobacteraceae bacterium]
MQTESQNQQVQGVAASSSDGTVLGVVSLAGGILGLIPTFGIIMSIVGLITGLVGRGQAKKASNQTGSILNLIGIIISSITLAIAFMTLLVFGGALFQIFR